MRRIYWWSGILILLATGLLLTAAPATVWADPNDLPGSSDPALFTRISGYHIEDYDDRDFDSVDMPSGSDGLMVTVEGHCTRLMYRINSGAKRASQIQIIRNYGNAVLKIGGQVLFQDTVFETLKVSRGASETWALIETRDEGDWYRLTIVEKEAMKQDVVADAASLASSLKDSGKAAIYGIYFDSGKAEIKTESKTSLDEIAKLLQADPKLQLYIVGHTDNVGGFDFNMKLSKERADAVLKALVNNYGINPGRLQAYGVGPLAPVASNQTEEGRAWNRRVELVVQ